ncbi:MAG TPA: outer membrane protein assembly factor BamE [Pyrinomonadaceae bacterium]|jgi:outer membrane protein assembly factor BamE (lipoprotein component of BamABCDE complex)
MSRTKKRAVIILSILMALAAFEAGREYVVYRMASNRLEGGYWKLQGRTGMTKDEVRAALGEPHHVETGATDENWYWYARESRGPLWRLVAPRGGYELNVQFDRTGRMLDVYSKVN